MYVCIVVGVVFVTYVCRLCMYVCIHVLVCYVIVCLMCDMRVCMLFMFVRMHDMSRYDMCLCASCRSNIECVDYGRFSFQYLSRASPLGYYYCVYVCLFLYTATL